jgi:hypothetical protein
VAVFDGALEYPRIDTSRAGDVYEHEYVLHWKNGEAETVPNGPDQQKVRVI